MEKLKSMREIFENAGKFVKNLKTAKSIIKKIQNIFENSQKILSKLVKIENLWKTLKIYENCLKLKGTI